MKEKKIGNSLFDGLIKRTVDAKQYVRKTAADYVKEKNANDKSDLSDIQKAILAMHESGVKTDQIVKMLNKYWRLSEDEANLIPHSFGNK